MDKNVLTLIGIIAICGTVLFVVDKQTSQSSQSPQQATPQSNPHANFEGYTFLSSGENKADYYFKNESGNMIYIKHSIEQYGIATQTRPRESLFGGVLRTEIKNKTTELDRIYININDCKNGYGILYRKNMNYETIQDVDWASGVNTVPSVIAEFLCNLHSKKN